jgi:indolepyruvate ferredoxin oxidoreductase beta subunit
MKAVSMKPVVNVVFAGPEAGAAALVLAQAAFHAGHDVKESQVGAGLASVRYGDEVLSPLVPRGEADFLVALDAAALEAARPLLREGGVVVGPPPAAGGEPAEALLAALASSLDLPEEAWAAARAGGGASGSSAGPVAPHAR